MLKVEGPGAQKRVGRQGCKGRRQGLSLGSCHPPPRIVYDNCLERGGGGGYRRGQGSLGGRPGVLPP